VPSCRACPASNNPSCVSLSDLLYEVPKLWDFTPSRYWNVLLSVNKEVRRQVQHTVTCIKITEALQPGQLHHLTEGGWSQLRCLDLSNSYMKAATAAQLSNGAWPLLQSLTLARGRNFSDLSTCSADVFRQFKGKWPLLKSLTVSMHRMDTVEVTALTETDWPLLRTLCIEPLDDAIPALMKGNWPELKNLSVGNEMTGGLEYLADLPWSTLQRLRVSFAQVTPSGMYSLIQAHLPRLQELCFVNTIWYTEGKDLAILGQAQWPLLRKLELIGVSASLEGIRHLVTGQWPMLHTVIFESSDITDKHIPLLVQAHWPNVQNLTLAGYFEHMEGLDMCMCKWPALQTLKLGMVTDQTNVWMSNMARDRWPSLDLQLI
jgi:hypothetical protein